jgi:hypothetical protein
VAAHSPTLLPFNPPPPDRRLQKYATSKKLILKFSGNKSCRDQQGSLIDTLIIPRSFKLSQKSSSLEANPSPNGLISAIGKLRIIFCGWDSDNSTGRRPDSKSPVESAQSVRHCPIGQPLSTRPKSSEGPIRLCSN